MQMLFSMFLRRIRIIEHLQTTTWGVIWINEFNTVHHGSRSDIDVELNWCAGSMIHFCVISWYLRNCELWHCYPRTMAKQKKERQAIGLLWHRLVGLLATVNTLMVRIFMCKMRKEYPMYMQWRNHTRAITGNARDEFISARVAPVLKMIRVSCA